MSIESGTQLKTAGTGNDQRRRKLLENFWGVDWRDQWILRISVTEVTQRRSGSGNNRRGYARFTQRNCSVKRVSTEDASCGCTEDSHGSRARERMLFKPRQRHRRLHSTSGTAVYTDVVRLVRLQKFLIHGCHVFACGGKFVVRPLPIVHTHYL